ncbi:hypothetical protein [Streptomyces sp. NPDC048428]
MPIIVLITCALCLIQAVPRPRWHPAAAWPAFVAFDLVLYFATKELVLPGLLGHSARTGFSEAPAEMAANMLLLATGAWLLWWKVPGSRPA